MTRRPPAVESYDLVVVGGGPGGYPGAIRASQLGLRVALVEEGRLGGECTNFGCIPTKAMMRPAEIFYQASKTPFIKGSLRIDYAEYMEWVEGVARRVSQGIEYLLKGYGVELYRARAELRPGGVVELSTGESLRAGKILLAPGSLPSRLPGVEVDGDRVHDSRTILSLRRKPSSILIVGGGYIGVEYAGMMAKMGVDVTLVELTDRLLPGMDEDLSRVARRSLERMGVRVATGTRVEELVRREGYIASRLSNGESLEAEVALIAVGRRPRTSREELGRVGVEVDGRGFIRVDEYQRTTAPNIYAAGDASGEPMLAHKAFAESLVAGENAAGGGSAVDYRAVPAVVFSDPEIVSVGYTMGQALRKGIDAGEVKLPIGGMARPLIEGSGEGFLKIVYEKPSKAVIGVHIAGPHASELAGEAALAIEMGATLEDLALTIHPHPTMSESIKEAAELALEKPIHYLLKRKRHSSA